MSSAGIDKWIKQAPQSWAKLAKRTNKTTSFETFKKKFLEGAEQENKGYLKKYLSESQIRTIYEEGAGGKKQTNNIMSNPVPIKLTRIDVTRKGKIYSRATSPRWELQSKFVLLLASKEKPRSSKYKEYVNILIGQGRTRQAVVKKIQRTRKGK